MLEDDARMKGWRRGREVVGRMPGGFLLGGGTRRREGRGFGQEELRGVWSWVGKGEREVLLLGLRYEREEEDNELMR